MQIRVSQTIYRSGGGGDGGSMDALVDSGMLDAPAVCVPTGIDGVGWHKSVYVFSVLVLRIKHGNSFKFQVASECARFSLNSN